MAPQVQVQVKAVQTEVPKDVEVHTVTIGDKRVVVGISDFKGRRYMEFRFLYEKPDGTFEGWERGRNGINIPIEDVEDVLWELTKVLSAYRGTKLIIAEWDESKWRPLAQEGGN